MAKKIGLAIFLVVVAFLAINFSAVRYGLQQAAGQAEVLWNAIPIEELRNNSKTPDSILAKFDFIEKVKAFATDSLGLKATDNYTTFYDQKGKPILWVVTASPEFKIEAHEWCFPIAGCFPYKGSFDLETAKSFEQKMKNLGFDTELDEVNAWSTLGWFKDPILSSMMSRSYGRLADLIIHESVHATLYVKDSVQFNENLASFIGKKGAEKFLRFNFGANSKELNNYSTAQEKSVLFRKFMGNQIEKLNSLYAGLDNTLPIEDKRNLKIQWIQNLKDDLLYSSYYRDTIVGKKRLENFNPNNAYFSGFSTYSKEFPQLEKSLEIEFNGNLKQMIRSFEKKYESL